jgi:hypothetical protein
MTSLGKILTFVNLVIAVAMASWSVSTYTTRPGWFDPKPEGPYPSGKEVENFAQLKEEIDSLGRTAIAAGSEWGAQRARLEGLETLRATRLKGYAERLEWAREGRDPKDPKSPAFFEPIYEERSGLLDLTSVGDPILGDDKQPLRGVNKLGSTTSADVAAIEQSSKEITKQRDQFKTIGAQILDTETRLLKMGVIRDAVQAELFHLASFEVNVYETRETVLRRKRQLVGRLAELGAK